MNILAIDPGSTQSAYIFFNKETKIIREHGIVNNLLLLSYLTECVLPSTKLCAIEMVASYGMPVGETVFNTCLWVGRFVQLCHREIIDCKLVYRKDIKIALCGSMKAKDSNIRQRLIDIYGEPGTKKKPGVTYGLKADEWSALAVAHFTCL